MMGEREPIKGGERKEGRRAAAMRGYDYSLLGLLLLVTGVTTTSYWGYYYGVTIPVHTPPCMLVTQHLMPVCKYSDLTWSTDDYVYAHLRAPPYPKP